MQHPLLSPFCMATIVLCLQWAASSHANSTGAGVQALAVCLGLPLTKSKMAGGPTLSYTHAAFPALSSQCPRAKAAPAQQRVHKITTNSPGFGEAAQGNREIKGVPTVAAIMETVILLDECCFWSDTVWSLIHSLELLYHSLILPVCKATSVLLTLITGIQLLARCMKSCQCWRESKQQSKAQQPESPPSMVWGAGSYTECAICLQAYKPGEGLKLLSCSHAYHSKCIDLWHRAQPRSKTCPLCLRSVTTVALIPLHTYNGNQE